MTSNWNRWGRDDERGAPNLVTPDLVAGAARLVREGRVLALGQTLDSSTAVSEGRPPLAHFMHRDGGDYAAGGRELGRSRYSEDVVVLGTHTGTHVDALAHVWYGEELYNGHPQHAVRSRGAARCGIDKLGPLVGRGVLLDVAGRRGGPLRSGEPIDGAELAACAEAAGVGVGVGDVVLVRTGWLGSAGDAYFAGEPGLDLDGARWLAERDVVAVGADNYAVEALAAGSTDGFPVHELLLRDCGVPLIEGLVLDGLAGGGAAEFLFMASPLPIRGGTASPTAPLAVL